MPTIDAYLKLGRDKGASDVHITVGKPPLVRIDGELRPLQHRPLEKEDTAALLTEILDRYYLEQLNHRGAVDISYNTQNLGRFRLNICHQRLGLTATCRVIPAAIPNLAELGLPDVIGEFCALNSGLVLVTGGTGTGKSTTLAAMINEINLNRNVNVITLEDPIEYLHTSQKSLVVQREMGTQVHSFHEGLHSSLRQDPDVILVGELRDFETIAAAVEAAETGHLVFGTFHTRGGVQTIHRLIDGFPADIQPQMRHTLSETLKAVVSQELIKAADGRGRRAAVEVMVMTHAIAQLVRDSKTHQIASAIATGRRLGMQLMDQSLLSLVQAGEVDPDEAFLKSHEKKDFIPYVKNTELLNMMDGPGLGVGGAGN